MGDAKALVRAVFRELGGLVVLDVVERGGGLVVAVVTVGGPVGCPVCGALSNRLHAWDERSPADLPVAEVRVELRVRVRRLVCQAVDCARKTFREQVPGVLGRYQRRTVRLAGTIATVVTELAGRAAVRVLPALGIDASRDTALRVLRGIPLPEVVVPRVLGIDDFALRRGHVYATVMIDAETGRRVDVIEGRGADVVKQWLLDHPGVQVVTRDGSAVTPRRSVRRCRTRYRSPTGSTCGTTWARPSRRRSPRTAPAGLGRRRPGCARDRSPRPPRSGGSRSTTFALPAWACWTAPAVWGSR